ncbi:hypothetical protein E2C01_001576 [Portunus trituberculatus]|uniref:PiggyBac transposable element-derived protein domain-containing protein n=1 Tax=Portunus trituberculatus TaxID=210409 RepID=A0A5B7CIB4_PORTR|nr:hypothetical protein [Portunus trituberculatus]
MYWYKTFLRYSNSAASSRDTPSRTPELPLEALALRFSSSRAFSSPTSFLKGSPRFPYKGLASAPIVFSPKKRPYVSPTYKVFQGVFELLVVLLQLLYLRLEGRTGARTCRELLLQLEALGCCCCKLRTSLFQTCFKALKPFNLSLRRKNTYCKQSNRLDVTLWAQTLPHPGNSGGSISWQVGQVKDHSGRAEHNTQVMLHAILCSPRTHLYFDSFFSHLTLENCQRSSPSDKQSGFMAAPVIQQITAAFYS